MNNDNNNTVVYERGENMLPDMDHYSLYVDYIGPEEDPMLGYSIENEHTGVVEYQGLTFPEAVQAAYELDGVFEKFLAQKSQIAVPSNKLVLPGSTH